MEGNTMARAATTWILLLTIASTAPRRALA
jgi:hypothetical protein